MSFRNYFLRGISWTATSSIINTSVNFSLILILAKYLSPSEMGAISIFLVIMSFLTMTSEFGLSSALIQKREITHAHFSSIFYFNLFFGIILSILFFYFAPFVNELFLNTQDLNIIKSLKFLSFNVIIVSAVQVYRAYFIKNLKFRAIAKIEIWSNIFFFISNIIFIIIYKCGIIGFVYSLIIKRFVELFLLSTFAKIFFKISKFRISHLKYFAYYGLSVTGDRLITFLANNLIINVIIGRSFGANALGQYNVAYRLLFQPQQIFSSVISRVSFPTFSYYQDDNQTVKNGYLKIIKYVSIFILPLNLIAYTFGPDLLHFFYEDKYLLAEEIIKIIAILGAFKFIITHVGPLIYSRGRADIGFIFNFFNLITTYLVLEFSKSLGLIYTLWIWVGASIILSLIIQFIGLRIIDSSILEYINSIKFTLSSFLMMIISIVVVEKILFKILNQNILIVVFTCLISIFVFIFSLFNFDLSFRRIVRKIFRFI